MTEKEFVRKVAEYCASLQVPDAVEPRLITPIIHEYCGEAEGPRFEAAAHEAVRLMDAMAIYEMCRAPEVYYLVDRKPDSPTEPEEFVRAIVCAASSEEALEIITGEHDKVYREQEKFSGTIKSGGFGEGFPGNIDLTGPIALEPGARLLYIESEPEVEL